MGRKIFLVTLAVMFCLVAVSGVSYAADKNKATPEKPAVLKPPIMPERPANLSMISGTIEKIDTKNAADMTVQVKDDATGSSRTISILPMTNITKATDVSELKVGDAVRVMSRKIDDKDAAIGIMFGNIRKFAPVKRPMLPQPPAAGAAKPAVKVETKK